MLLCLFDVRVGWEFVVMATDSINKHRILSSHVAYAAWNLASTTNNLSDRLLPSLRYFCEFVALASVGHDIYLQQH